MAEKKADATEEVQGSLYECRQQLLIASAKIEELLAKLKKRKAMPSVQSLITMLSKLPQEGDARDSDEE